MIQKIISFQIILILFYIIYINMPRAASEQETQAFRRTTADDVHPRRPGTPDLETSATTPSDINVSFDPADPARSRQHHSTSSTPLQLIDVRGSRYEGRPPAAQSKHVKAWMRSKHLMTHSWDRRYPELKARDVVDEDEYYQYTSETVGCLLETAWHVPDDQGDAHLLDNSLGQIYRKRAVAVLKKYMEDASPPSLELGDEHDHVTTDIQGSESGADSLSKKELLSEWVRHQMGIDGEADTTRIPPPFMKYMLDGLVIGRVAGTQLVLYEFIRENSHMLKNISKTFASTLTDVIKEMAKDLAEGFLEGNMDIPTGDTPLDRLTAMNFDPTAAGEALAGCGDNVIQAVALLVANAQVAVFKNKMMLALETGLDPEDLTHVNMIIKAIIDGDLFKLMHYRGMINQVSDILESFGLDRYKVGAIGLLLKGDIDGISKNPMYKTFNYFRHLNFDPLHPLSSIKASWVHIREKTVTAIIAKLDSRGKKSARILKHIAPQLKSRGFELNPEMMQLIVRRMAKESMEEPAKVALKGFLETAKAIGASIPGIATITSILSSSGDFLMKLYFEAVDMISEVKIAALDLRTKMLDLKTQKLEETVREIKEHYGVGSLNDSLGEDGQTQEMEDEAVGEVEAREVALQQEIRDENAEADAALREYTTQYAHRTSEMSPGEKKDREDQAQGRAGGSRRRRRHAVHHVMHDANADADPYPVTPLDDPRPMVNDDFSILGFGQIPLGEQAPLASHPSSGLEEEERGGAEGGGARNKISKKRKTIRRGKPKMRKTIRRKKSKMRKTIRRKKSKMKTKKRKTMRRKR